MQGMDLTYNSAKILSKIKGIQEFNIGHFLIGESIFVGLSNQLKNLKKF
jgi:pyridoxine 5-phosphate synthase